MRNALALRLHTAVDNWWQQDKTVVDMKPLTAAEVERYRLMDGSYYGCTLNVPSDALVVDFVVSDRDEQIWDNNGGRDYHTRVQVRRTPT